MTPSSREVDRMVAEKIFGKKVKQCPIHHMWECCGTRIPDYSTSISDAWLVVEKMRELGYAVEIDDGGTRGTDWVCMFSNCRADAPTIPKAICLAALRALSPQEEGK